MRIKLYFFILTTFCSSIYAETVLKVFPNEVIRLPDSCYFIVRGGEGKENNFSCPNSKEPFRSVTFPPLQNIEESQAKIKQANKEANKEAADFYSEPILHQVIDGKNHYLWVWYMFGESHQSYTVCDFRSCINLSLIHI